MIIKSKKLNFSKIKLLAVLNIILVLVLDQVSKFFMVKNFDYHREWSIFKVLTEKLNFGLSVFVTNNYGTSFSLIKVASESTIVVLIATSVTICLILAYWLYRESSNNKVTIIAISLVMGGALGNIIDRFTLGYVVDFVDMYIGQYHWPVFNVADIAISIGALVLCYELIKHKN